MSFDQRRSARPRPTSSNVVWTTGASARTTDGHAVAFDDPAAYCFCAMGALARSLRDAGWWCPLQAQSALYGALQQGRGRIDHKVEFDAPAGPHRLTRWPTF